MAGEEGRRNCAGKGRMSKDRGDLQDHTLGIVLPAKGSRSWEGPGKPHCCVPENLLLTGEGGSSVPWQ